MKKILFVILGILILVTVSTADAAFTGPELLGRPTHSSVTINVVADTGMDVYFEYGTESGVYTGQTAITSSVANEPTEVVIDGLQDNTRYYYRMVYREVGSTAWIYRDEHSFHTHRSPVSTFTFTIISDSHMNGGGGNVALYQQTLNNVLTDNPDFHLDLGDTFWMDGVTSSTTANQRYLQQRQYMGTISHSVPIFVSPGNHENEEGWNFNDTPSKGLLSVNARKLYYPNPIPDNFYSGNTDNTLTAIDGDHLREDYYAWEWGDALFVVIDPYQYTMIKPYAGSPGGEDNDETVIGDRWSWTLGEQQYQWFKQTLQNSNAKFKFVFAHHVTGGTEDYVRGGAAAVPYCEWGGYNTDGTTWGFDVKRPGWDAPIHQLMVANAVNAFFHGHDHEYAFEERDGIVYQLVPSPSMTGYGFNLYHESDPYTIRVLPNPGHLRVTVSPSQVTVDYVATTGGTINYTYTITANTGNHPPVANNQSVTTNQDAAKAITLSATDVDGDTLTYSIVTSPIHGTLSGTLPNVTYTPVANYSGSDSFTFKANDGKVDSNIATVSITVSPQPTLTSISVSPASASITVNATQQFTAMAKDQFGNPMSVQPSFTWTVSGGGTINSSGLFTAGSTAGGPFTLTAASGNVSGTASVTITPLLVLTSISVSPSSASVPVNATQQFTATAKDQLGNPLVPQPSFTWTVSGGGTINSSGLFTAGSTAGDPYTVTAASGGVSGPASVTVTAASTFTIGETNILSVDDSGNGNLLVAQQVVFGQNATILSMSFYVTTASGNLRLGIYDATGPNGSPGVLKAQTAAFTPVSGWNTQNVVSPVSLPAGTYWLAYLPSSSNLAFRMANSGSAKWYSYSYQALPATFSTSPTSGTYHWSFYATLQTAPPTLTSISVSPSSASITVNATQQFTAMAKDQFGNPMSVQPSFTWTVSGGGTINSNGLFTAGSTAGGPYTVTAASGGVSGTASVTVTSASVLTSISVSPASASVAVNGTQQFTATAKDQLGNPLVPQPSFTWMVSGGGTINSNGLFTAGSTAGGPYTVTAASGSVSGTASVTVTVASTFTIGETNILSVDDSGNGNLLVAQQVVLGKNATILSMSFYVTTTSGNLRLGIYDATGPNGSPGVLKAQTAAFTPVSGWNTQNVVSPVSLPAGTYWLAYLPSSSNLAFRMANSGSAKWYSYSYQALPATFSTSPMGGTYHWSFYATLQ